MEGASQTSREPSVRIAQSRGFAISYEDVGHGAPVVLIAGLTGSARQMREDGYVDRLAAGRRVLNVDPLGHGRSEKPSRWEAYRNPAVAADVIAILGGGGNLGTNPPLPDPPPYAGALARGDRDAFWSGMGISVYGRQKRHFESSDPKAIAAAIEGNCRSTYVVDLGWVAAPALVYCGGGDDPDTHRLTAEALGVDLHLVGDGDHPRTLLDLDGVMPLALAPLAAAGF